ncbi:MAG: tagaturonate reductase [Flavisolibacter sp.]
MILSRYTLKNINPDAVSVPDESLFNLPETVLQFGAGALVRAIPGYFIDKANRAGTFNGRIVAVRMNPSADTFAFNKQDGLYTHCIRDVRNGEKTEETLINSSISRVLNAVEQWNEVLDCAHNRDIQIVISDTGEVGIQLVPEDIRQHPPRSYPGKLLAFLHERFHAFGGSAHSGMIIIATEAIPGNGKRLESIVLELAHLNGLEEEFIEWLENHNRFCNSLVDRIVPTSPDTNSLAAIKDQLEYDDELLIISEHHALWAIEGDLHLREVFSFAQSDNRVFIAEDIQINQELQIHLLNAPQILSSGVCFFFGKKTVKDAMDDRILSSYITHLMQDEIATAVPSKASTTTIEDFATKVLLRFKNPYINHLWLSITNNYSVKMKEMCLPILLKHYEETDAVPERIALGLAAYIYFMKPIARRDHEYYGEYNGETYLIDDEQAEVFFRRWTGLSVASLVQVVLSDAYWGCDIQSLPGFKQSVIEKLNLIINNGMRETIESIPTKKIKAA